jgi:hypothetical protein
MRGALISFSAGLCLATAIPALPAAASGTQTIVQEKAAAIGIVRTKARKYTASLAQGRLFHAYLSASTQSEGDRLKGRIMASLKGLQNRYGLNDFTVIGRDGEVFAHVGSQPTATEKRNVKKDPVLVAGFAQEAHTVSTLMDDDAVTYIAPVVLNGEREFVISIEQDLSAYEKVLALGLGRSLYVVIIDPAGNVVSDSNGSGAAGKKALIAGLTFDELRQQISASGTEGTGVVSKDGKFFNVSFQTVDDWTVVAIEQAPQDATCLRNGNRSCQ